MGRLIGGRAVQPKKNCSAKNDHDFQQIASEIGSDEKIIAVSTERTLM